MISTSSALLLMGALQVAAATFLFVARMVQTHRARMREASGTSAQPGPAWVAPRYLLSSVILITGLCTVAYGVMLADSLSAIHPVPLYIACIAMGAAAAVPGVPLVLRGLPAVVEWADAGRVPPTPRLFRAGVTYAAVALTGVGVFLPMSFFIFV